MHAAGVRDRIGRRGRIALPARPASFLSDTLDQMMLATRLTAAAAVWLLAPLAAHAQGAATDPARGTNAGAVTQGTAAQQSKAEGPANPVGSAEAGGRKNFQCIGCHEIAGYKASFPAVYMVPKIAGQSARYIESALIAYRKGERSHPTMRAIAGSLTDQDILDLAAYYGTK